MKYFIFLVFLINSILAMAEYDPTRAALLQAQRRIEETQSHGDQCHPSSGCSAFLQTLQNEDYESGFFGLLESRAPACQASLNTARGSQISQRFSGAADMQNQLAAKYPELGAVNHQRAALCAGAEGGDSISRYRVSKFYYYEKRFNEAATRVVEELSAINSLIGDKVPLPCQKPADGLGSLDQAYNRCLQLKEFCANESSQLATVAAKSEADEALYKEKETQIRQLQSDCLVHSEIYERFGDSVSAANPTFRHCEYQIVSAGAGVEREVCTNLTWSEKQRIGSCRVAVEKLQIARAVLEDVNPWFKSENYFKFRKSKSVAESIKEQSILNRAELQKKYYEFREGALCVNGYQPADRCDTDKIRKALAATPQLEESYGGDKRKNAAQVYLGAQACIEEGVSDLKQTASTLNGAARDAVLTIATAGLSGAVVGVRAAVAVSRGARLAGLASFAIDGFYASQSYVDVVKSCTRETQKLDAVARPENTTQCPGPASSQAQAQREFTNCAMASVDAALNSLPFVPGIAKVARKLANAASAPPPVNAAVKALAAVRTFPAPGFRDLHSIKDPDKVPWSHTENAELARAPVLRKIDTKSVESVSVDGRSFEGQSNNGLEIIDYNGRKGFVKVLVEQPDEYLANANNEVFYTDLLSRENMGPKLLGSYVGADNHIRIATDFVEGTHVHIGFVPTEIASLSAASIDEMEAMAKRLVDEGINPEDLQFRIDAKGHPLIVDPARFSPLQPGQSRFWKDQFEEDFCRLREARGLIPPGTTDRLIKQHQLERSPTTKPVPVTTKLPPSL